MNSRSEVDGLSTAINVNGVGLFADVCGRDEAVHRTSDAANRRIGDAGGDAGRSALGLTIERDIIPRLLLAHGLWADVGHVVDDAAVPTAEDVAALTGLLIRDDGEEAFAFVDRVRARGVGQERVLMDLLAPAARRLGLMWETDECSFLDVTVGLFRLQQLLARISNDGATALEDGDEPFRVLLAPAPGEQHTFGILILQELLRRDGFDAWVYPSGDPDDLTRVLAGTTFSAFGLSAASESSLSAVRTVIRDGRRVSANRDLCVMVGGRAVTDSREPAIGRKLAKSLGADIVTIDARDAITHLRTKFFGSAQANAHAPTGRAAGD